MHLFYNVSNFTVFMSLVSVLRLLFFCKAETCDVNVCVWRMMDLLATSIRTFQQSSAVFPWHRMRSDLPHTPVVDSIYRLLCSLLTIRSLYWSSRRIYTVVMIMNNVIKKVAFILLVTYVTLNTSTHTRAHTSFESSSCIEINTEVFMMNDVQQKVLTCVFVCLYCRQTHRRFV